MLFRDRVDAGRRLAARLRHLAGEDLVVLGLPRGGVTVAREVAAALGAPLDIILVRKLGLPGHPELAMGAIGEGGARVINERVLYAAGLGDDDLLAVEEGEAAELERRARRYRGGRAPTPLAGKTALIVDDGIATGATARAACLVARAHGAARVILAAPVVPPATVSRLLSDADDVVFVEAPEPFFAIGEWYADFTQVTDDEVAALLDVLQDDAPHAGASVDEEVVVEADGLDLPGRLTIPPGAVGVVVFAHGSGSSRHSPRNRFVAETLNRAGLGTLLFDLLLDAEAEDRRNVFDIPLLGRRLVGAARWWRMRTPRDLAIGFFGSSTGAAAAIWAAAEVDAGAVVSRGGRPDLAASRLAEVRAPTLLIVGARDATVLELNRAARARLTCPSRLDVIPGAAHLFEEPGALEEVARLAGEWFVEHLGHATSRLAG
jgi:putative phosphoribosyl transferase